MRSNKNVLISHDTHFVDMGYPQNYEYVIIEQENTYGIDEIPTVPLRGE
jgi:hypothetical protein